MHNKRLNARELQHALLPVLEKSQTQNATEYGALAAAISITTTTRGADLTDLVALDMALSTGKAPQ